MATKLLLSLMGVFAPLSFASIGGGQTIIADVQRQVVDVHHWMTQAAFLEAFAISRMAPGPGSLLATLIGWHVAGLAGAIVATIGIFGPATFLIYGVALLWKRHQGARWMQALEQGLRPVAAGMILATVFVLLKSLDGGLLARLIAFASTAVLMTTRTNALLLLVGGAVLFIAIRSTIT